MIADKRICFRVAFIGICLLVGCEPTDIVTQRDARAAFGQRDMAINKLLDLSLKQSKDIEELKSRLDKMEVKSKEKK